MTNQLLSGIAGGIILFFILFAIIRYIYKWFKTSIELIKNEDQLEGMLGAGERIAGTLMLVLGLLIATLYFSPNLLHNRGEVIGWLWLGLGFLLVIIIFLQRRK